MRLAPLGASLVLHAGLGVAAAVVVPRASARVATVVPVDLVVIEPASPPAPVPATPSPPRRLTPPKPLTTPVPKLEERPPSPPPAPVEPSPPPPVAATPPAPTPAISSPPEPSRTLAATPSPAPVSPPVALPQSSAPASGTRPPDTGVSVVHEIPTPARVASIPPDGVTRVARPTGGYQVRPSYPSTARRLGVQGTAMLRVHVLADGRVGAVEVEESAGHPDLDEAARDAIRRWRFEPARRGEEAVAMWVRVPVDFRLK